MKDEKAKTPAIVVSCVCLYVFTSDRQTDRPPAPPLPLSAIVFPCLHCQNILLYKPTYRRHPPTMKEKVVL
jgi:hypothetical protein